MSLNFLIAMHWLWQAVSSYPREYRKDKAKVENAKNDENMELLTLNEKDKAKDSNKLLSSDFKTINPD